MSQRSKWPALLLAPGLIASGTLAARTAQAVPAIGVTDANALIRFNTSAPGTLTAGPTTITGLQGGVGEVIVGIDVRPANQQLYAIGKAGTVGRIYTINPATGAATFVATLAADPADLTAPFAGLGGAEFGTDFNPVPDRLRVTSDTDENLRINVDTGAVTTDGTLAFAAGDVNAGGNPSVTAVAYTNSVAGATTTTLYGLDFPSRALVIQNPPNNGTLNTIGPAVTSDAIGLAGFDIAPGATTGFATYTSPSFVTTSFLYSINLASPSPNLVGEIGGGARVRGLALLPDSLISVGAAYTVGENAGSVTIPVLRSGDVSAAATVDFVTAAGTATAGSDFTSTSGTLSFAAGQRIATIAVPILFSTAAESDETFTVTLSNPVGTSSNALGTRVATVTITDSASGATVPDATLFALTASNRLLSFSSNTPGTLSSNVAVSGLGAGENLLGIDFRPANGQLYALSSASRIYTINTATGAATAIGAPGAFTLSGTEFGFDFNPVPDRIRVTSDAEQNLRLNPNDGTLTATDGTLAYAAGDISAGTNPEVVGSGYTNSVAGATSTTLYNIDAAAGTLVVQNPPNNGTLVTVGPLGLDPSGITGFDIALGNVGLAAIASGAGSGLFAINLSTGTASGIGAIGTNEEIRGLAVALPGTISLGAATATVAESAGSITLTLTRTGSNAASVNVAITSAGQNAATAGSDYTNPNFGRVAFAAGETSKMIQIPILNDTEDEADETFTVTLSAPVGATLGAVASQVVTITDDDAPRVASVSSPRVNEGDSGTTSAVFTVSLSTPSASPVSVNYATADGTAVAGATAGAGDYAGTSGTLTFAPGETSKNVTVAVNGDLIAEGNETFLLRLSSPVNTTLSASASGTATIVDDDAPALSLVLSASTLSESGTVTGTISRNTATTAALVVALNSSDSGEASVPASVTIPAGATSATFTVSGVDDGVADGAQNALVTATANGLAAARANITVSDSGGRPNAAPVGAPDSYSTTGRVITVAAPGVLSNDRDPEGRPLSAILLGTPAHGEVVLAADGSFTYTPSGTYSGSDTFVYVASDGVGQSAPVTVTLQVGPARDVTPPTVTLDGGALRTLRSLAIVRGSAVDTQVTRSGAVASSGLRNVVLRLQRGDGQYYNGRGYQRAAFDLPAAFIGRVFFSLAGTLPASTPDGRYLVTAIATDNAGNRAVAQQAVLIDTVAPAPTITTPAAGSDGVARVARLDQLTVFGTLDTARVLASVRRSDGQYFNGRAFQAAFIELPLSLVTGGARRGVFTLSLNVPAEAASYTITVRAADQAGNVGTATRPVVVASVPAS